MELINKNGLAFVLQLEENRVAEKEQKKWEADFERDKQQQAAIERALQRRDSAYTSSHTEDARQKSPIRRQSKESSELTEA